MIPARSADVISKRIKALEDKIDRSIMNTPGGFKDLYINADEYSLKSYLENSYISGGWDIKFKATTKLNDDTSYSIDLTPTEF